MSMSKKLKWRRAINELKYLYSELELITQTCKDASRDFEMYYREYCARTGLNIGELERQNSERMANLFGETELPVIEDGLEEAEITPGTLICVDNPKEFDSADTSFTEEDKEIHEIFSKLFKKIAIALHPDKVSALDISPFLAEEMIDTFKSAKKAYDERKYFVLIEVAEKYEIYPPDNYSRQSKWFRRESARVQSLITSQKNTYNYIFSECPDWQKDELIRRFLNRLFGI
jgi:hypothetical protein